MNIYVYRDNSGKYHWELQDDKSNVIAESAVKFDKTTTAITAIEHILSHKKLYKGVSLKKPDLDDNNIEKWFWALNNNSGQAVAKSPMGYNDKAVSQKGITQLLSLTLGGVKISIRQ